jgi:hypothetical protein
MTTTTTALRSPPGAAGQFLAGLLAITRSVAQFIRRPAPGAPETAAALLRLAATYESSQPSYAADLRAAASMHERVDGPTG